MSPRYKVKFLSIDLKKIFFVAVPVSVGDAVMVNEMEVFVASKASVATKLVAIVFDAMVEVDVTV